MDITFAHRAPTSIVVGVDGGGASSSASVVTHVVQTTHARVEEKPVTRRRDSVGSMDTRSVSLRIDDVATNSRDGGGRVKLQMQSLSGEGVHAEMNGETSTTSDGQHSAAVLHVEPIEGASGQKSGRSNNSVDVNSVGDKDTSGRRAIGGSVSSMIALPPPHHQREGSHTSGEYRSASEQLQVESVRTPHPVTHRDPSIRSFGAASMHGTLVDALSAADSDATSRVHYYDDMSIGTGMGVDCRSNADAKSLTMRGHGDGRHDGDSEEDEGADGDDEDDVHDQDELPGLGVASSSVIRQNESTGDAEGRPRSKTSSFRREHADAGTSAAGGDGFHDVALDSVEVVVAEVQDAWVSAYLSGSAGKHMTAFRENSVNEEDDVLGGFGRRSDSLSIAPATAASMLSGVSVGESMDRSASRSGNWHSIYSTSSSVASRMKSTSRQLKLLAPLSDVTVGVDFDRLALQQMLDRDAGIVHSLACIALAGAVSGFACALAPHYTGFSVGLMWFVVASCHYALLKCPQPDSASPALGVDTHVTSLSRSAYFSAIALCIILLRGLDCAGGCNMFTMYDVPLLSLGVVNFMALVLQVVILAFPAIFLLGLLPQIKTFVFYALEQTDVHLLGGTGSASLSASAYSVLKCAIVTAICAPLCASALHPTGGDRPGETKTFSAYVGLIVGLSHLLSKRPSSVVTAWSSSFGNVFRACAAVGARVQGSSAEAPAVFPRLSVSLRLVSDVLSAVVIGVAYFLLHLTGCFTALQPVLKTTIVSVAAAVGFVSHYVGPQLRKRHPFLLIAQPLLRSAEYGKFEPGGAAKLVWFERVYVCAVWVEKHVLYPVIFVGALANDIESFAFKLHWTYGAALVATMAGIKLLRGTFMDPSRNYIILVATLLVFKWDAREWTEMFLLDYFVMSIVVSKLFEFCLKIRFVCVYLAPWNQGWGSAVHVLLQPLGIPHMTLLFVLAMFSSIFSAPFFPFVGSAVFLVSYVRPMKFWERNYTSAVPVDVVDADGVTKTETVDLPNESGSRTNNLNALFYQHLALSLQQSLCGDITMGRWGAVSAGDFFLLFNDRLTSIVHIVAVGNGFVTFQLRGLEFKGTYCQQRELEAINRNVALETEGMLCFKCVGRAPGMLTFNAALAARWCSWELVSAECVVDSYSIVLNPAASMFNTFEFKMSVLKHLVGALSFLVVASPHLLEWIGDGSVVANALDALPDDHALSGAQFSSQCDPDYDEARHGVSLASFDAFFGDWIRFCVARRSENGNVAPIPADVAHTKRALRLCFLLGAFARRRIHVVGLGPTVGAEDSFVAGYSSLFRGHCQLSAPDDSWAVSDSVRLGVYVRHAARLSMKLHQDSFFLRRRVLMIRKPTTPLLQTQRRI
eukprot:Opistho-2@60235